MPIPLVPGDNGGNHHKRVLCAKVPDTSVLGAAGLGLDVELEGLGDGGKEEEEEGGKGGEPESGVHGGCVVGWQGKGKR